MTSTRVLLTHLHTDHVGRNTQLVDGRWVPTFRNAQYVFSGIEYEALDALFRAGADPRGFFEDSVQLIVAAGQACWSRPYRVGFIDGLMLHPTPGHSIDHWSISMARAAKLRCSRADAVMQFHPVQVDQLAWSSVFCAAPDDAQGRAGGRCNSLMPTTRWSSARISPRAPLPVFSASRQRLCLAVHCAAALTPRRDRHPHHRSASPVSASHERMSSIQAPGALWKLPARPRPCPKPYSTPAEARENSRASRRALSPEPPAVAFAGDLSALGIGGEILLRLYRGAGLAVAAKEAVGPRGKELAPIGIDIDRRRAMVVAGAAAHDIVSKTARRSGRCRRRRRGCRCRRHR